MDYEKKHEEIVRATQLWENGDITREQLEYIFPELKESEDEKIRKELYDFCIKCSHGDTLVKQQTDFLRWATWLEKQGEQTPTDKVEPKFKVGDWITDGNITIQIEAIKNDCYLYCGDCALYSIKTADKVYHLWTIQDAKDGDVLQLGEVIAIFKKYIGNEHCTCYCSFCKAGGFEIPIAKEDNVYGCYNATPITKEQHDQLEKAMVNAGYKWNKKERKLEKIEDGPLVIDEGKSEMDRNFTEMMLKDYNKQKPAWGEEDEEMRIDAIKYLELFDAQGIHGDVAVSCIEWLKSLKDRVQPQWKPSNEQLNALHDAAVYVDKSMFPHPKGILMKMYKQLKKL